MAAWRAWIGELGDAFVDVGNPFGAFGRGEGGRLGRDGRPGSAATRSFRREASTMPSAKARAARCFAGGGSVDVYETFEIM